MTTGIPQGSVLEPLLLMLYINDLPDHISSNIRLFADDCVLYKKITSAVDASVLQDDLKHVDQ